MSKKDRVTMERRDYDRAVALVTIAKVYLEKMAEEYYTINDVPLDCAIDTLDLAEDCLAGNT